MEHLTYDKAWKLCMEQWGDMEKDGFGNIFYQKRRWVKRSAYQNVVYDCFFCEYASQQGTSVSRDHPVICRYCPARQIEPNFNCGGYSNHHYLYYPHKFHAKIKELYKIYKGENINIKEAYKTMQAEWVKLYDVKVGTKVKVLRTNKLLELGTTACGHTQSEIDEDGELAVVYNIVDREITVATTSLGNHRFYPFFVLEVVGQPKVKEMTVKEISEMAGCTVEVIE